MRLCVFILISLANSLSPARVLDNGVSDYGDAHSNAGRNRSRRQLTCRSDQWQCKNGYCISRHKLCDQTTDCSDNSDETSPLCRKRAINNASICILPPHPEHGRYDVEDIADARPGQAHSSFVLTVRCRRGFGVVDLYGDGSGTQQVYCVNGKWYQNMPKCVRFCKLDPDPSIRYMCYTRGTGIEVCKNYVSPGTLVQPACNTPVYDATELLRDMKCESGVWNYYAQCKVDCGRIAPGEKPLLIGGTEATYGELPWHAAIYRKKPEVLTQICAGSLVSRNIVISAAHCFWKGLPRLLPASQFGVAVGKLHRAWDSEEDVYAQKSLVKEIKIEDLYEDVAANFQEDIAILILSTPFNYTTYIRPVCLDFNLNIESLQLQHGVLGKVAGWGLTGPNGKPSETLKVLSLPFINERICVNTLPDTFRGSITGDKFCGGFTNGTSVCHGDSGGGLAFPSEELFRERYYLRGIVSTAPRDKNKLCNDNTYTTFTKISKHQKLIFDALAENDKKICPLYSFQCADGSCVNPGADCNGKQDCADGSDESDDLCRVGTPPQSLEENSRTCVLPPYPDHGTYKVANLARAEPGQAYNSFTLKVICKRGYGMGEPFDDGGGTAQVYCVNGEWSQSMPKCVRFCKLDPDPSIRYMCLSGTGIALCKKYLPPEISVEPICNSPIYYSTESFARMSCNSGYWNYVAVCKAECGRITPSGKQLVVGGTVAKQGELPWHAGIYQKTKVPYRQLCGGSLVSNNVVISAAHCFWRDVEKLLPASEFGVALGKVYRSWDSDEDFGAQKSDVKEIKIPALYQGAAANFQEDIAVLILSTFVTYTTYIRPVCLNFDVQFDKFQLQHGNLGKVAGWSYTAVSEQVSPALKVVDVPFIDIATCISTLPQSFREYITSDKLCAGYTNGTATVCTGDSGGGLAFPSKELGIDRYYLRGVASAAPPTEDGLCNVHAYVTFTKITKHQEFIQEALEGSVSKICPSHSFECSDGSCVDSGLECNGKLDCADGSDESDKYCQVTRTKI